MICEIAGKVLLEARVMGAAVRMDGGYRTFVSVKAEALTTFLTGKVGHSLSRIYFPPYERLGS